MSALGSRQRRSPGIRSTWEAAAFAEIEKFPSELLAHHYPNVPNRGDMTRFKEWPDDDAIDLLVGGTPCQSFSVAGLRAGLADPRGNLALTYLAIAAKYRPRWLVWENVPGVLSADEGRAFGSILGGMGELGYGVAYRTLDAQFCRTLGFAGAVPQRRRRVFVVGYFGDWRRAAAVLFDGASLRGDPAPRREAGQTVAEPLIAGAANGGPAHGARSGHAKETNLIPEVANPLTARMVKGVNTTMDEGVTMIGEAFAFKPSHFTRDKDGAPAPVTPPLSADADKGDQDTVVLAPIPFDTTQITHPENRSNPQPGDPAGSLAKGGHAPVIAFHGTQDPDISGDVAHPIGTNRGQEMAIAFQDRFRGDDGRGYDRPPPASIEVTGSLETVKPWNIAHGWRVRRLTPTECERLQGFPDGYTQIPRGNKPTADGPRYKALGNSMAVNCMRVLGQRIQMVEDL